MIKIKNHETNIENTYFVKKSIEIKGVIKETPVGIYKWIEENLDSILLGYKNKERTINGKTLKSLEKIIEEVNSKYGKFFINNNLYIINSYFNNFLTENEESSFYEKLVDIDKAREFLSEYEYDDVYKEEINVYSNFLTLLENKDEDKKLPFQNKELEKLLIHKVFKKDMDKGLSDFNNFNKRLLKIENFEVILDKFIQDSNKQKRLSTLLKDENIKQIEKIFNYSKFTNDKDYGRHDIITSLNVSVCPYCNRQYVTSYGKPDNKKTTADLDHYYPKSKYPYLALSLYNFIPSCQICNSRMKGDKEGHLYPYDDECGDKAIFKTSNNSINGILNSKATDFEIEFKIQDHKITDKEYRERLKKSNEIFRLEEVYKTSHNQYIIDMLHTIEHYPDSYLETIADIFEKKEELQKKEELKRELRNLLKKPYQDRIERNDTLAKLTKDILTEYDRL